MEISGFSNFYPLFSEFQALDFVVSEAKKYKIRLILSFTNNWEAYGGKAQYVKWGKAAGLNLTSDDDFFCHPTLKSYFKAHVKASQSLILMSEIGVIGWSRYVCAY